MTKLIQLLSDPLRLRLAIERRFFSRLAMKRRRANVVMFHIGRSGSTVIGDMLQQHAAVYWGGEIYEKLIPNVQPTASNGSQSIDPIMFLDREMANGGSRIYGFEVKFYNLKVIGTPLPEYISSLTRSGITHFMVLERRNYLRKIVSSIVAHQKKQFHQSASEPPSLTKIILDVANVQIDLESKPLMAYLQSYAHDFVQLNSLLTGHNVLCLTYEDDVCDDPLKGYKRICQFLNIPDRPVQIRLGKTNPFPLHEVIANFPEVERELTGTPYAWMLYKA